MVAAEQLPEIVDGALTALLVLFLKGELLLLMGELDENVPPGQIPQFVNSLIKDIKDFELTYMPSRDHQFIGDGYVTRRDGDFMVRNLLGREPPGYRVEVNHR
jgi:dienelactone hydrolase